MSAPADCAPGPGLRNTHPTLRSASGCVARRCRKHSRARSGAPASFSSRNGRSKVHNARTTWWDVSLLNKRASSETRWMTKTWRWRASCCLLVPTETSPTLSPSQPATPRGRGRRRSRDSGFRRVPGTATCGSPTRGSSEYRGPRHRHRPRHRALPTNRHRTRHRLKKRGFRQTRWMTQHRIASHRMREAPHRTPSAPRAPPAARTRPR